MFLCNNSRLVPFNRRDRLKGYENAGTFGVMTTLARCAARPAQRRQGCSATLASVSAVSRPSARRKRLCYAPRFSLTG